MKANQPKFRTVHFEYSSLFFTFSESKGFQEHLAICPHFLRNASWIKLFAYYKSQTFRYHSLKPNYKSPPSKGKALVQFTENNIKRQRSVETKTNGWFRVILNKRWNNQWILNNWGRNVRAPSVLEVVLKVACCEGSERRARSLRVFPAQPPRLTLKPLSSRGEQWFTKDCCQPDDKQHLFMAHRALKSFNGGIIVIKVQQ